MMTADEKKLLRAVLGAHLDACEENASKTDAALTRSIMRKVFSSIELTTHRMGCPARGCDQCGHAKPACRLAKP